MINQKYGLVLMCAVWILIGARPATAAPQLQAVQVTAPPVVDGRLDDPCWQAAPPAGDFVYVSGGSPDDPVPVTTLRVVCDAENLYVAVRAEALPSASGEDRDTAKPVRQTFAIAFDTRYHRQYRPAFGLRIEDDGTWSTKAADALQTGDLPLEVAVRRETDFVAVEARIPFAVIHPLGVGDNGWGFNVIRQRRVGDDESAPPVVSAWSKGDGRADRPGDFGRLHVQADTGPFHCVAEEDGEGRPGDNRAGTHFDTGLTVRIAEDNGQKRILVGNNTGSFQRLVAEVSGDVPWAPARFEVGLRPGQSHLLPPRLPASFNKLDLIVKDADTGLVRFQGSSRQEEVVVPAEPEWDATNADRDLGYVVFMRNYVERGTRYSVPRPDERDDSLQLLATPGQYEPVSFSVHAVRDQEQVRVEVSGLAGPDGAVIPAASAKVELVESMTWWMTPLRYRRIEAYLIRNRPRDIPTGFTQRYWLTVRVPDDATAGRYEGRVRINPADGRPSEIPVRLDVLPFQLSPPVGMNYFLYAPSTYLPSKVFTAKYHRRMFEAMREYGMTTSTMYAYPGDSGTDLTTDTNRCLPMVQQMELMRQVGLIGQGAAVPWLGGEVFGPDAWKTVFGEAQRRSWPEIVLYVVDEPGPATYDAVRKTMARIERFRKDHPEYPVRTTTAGGENPEVCEYYDVWIANTHGLISEVMARARKFGKTVWSYDCNLGPVDTLTTRHYFGLWCWKNGVKGASFWAAFSLNQTDGRLVGGCPWRGTEQDLVEYVHRYNYLYPGRDEVFVSIGLAAARQGANDYRYLLTLIQTIEAAKEAKVAGATIAAAEACLAKVRDGIDGDAMGEVARRTWQEFGMEAAWYDRPAPDPGLGAADYNRIRRELADQIIALRQVMGATRK